MDLIYQVLVVIFGVLTVYFANGLVKAKRIAADVSMFLKETSETLDMIGTATADNVLTQEELSKIALQAQENLATAKSLINDIKELAGILSAFLKK